MAETVPDSPYRVTARVRIRRGDDVLYGSGISELLRRCEHSHSLHAAAKEMHMPYRKALFIVKRAEQGFGRPILKKSIGGAGGGGSYLTPFGHALLTRFDALESEVKAYAEARMQAHFGDLSEAFPACGEAQSPDSP